MLHVIPEPASDRNLEQKIVKHDALVGVVGIGYVGLPLAVEKAKVGFHVIGYDCNPARVAAANAGRSYIGDVPSEDLAGVVASELFSATTDVGELAACDVIVICVPTPLTPNRDPDISYIKATAHLIAPTLRAGQLVCLESTTYPGTTEEVLLPILQSSGLTVGIDFFLAFSPERVDPGNQRYTTRNTSKIVGGVTPACLRLAHTFYAQTIAEVIEVSSPRIAEMSKVFENTFRAVNIALVNEMALLCDRMGISIWEVLDAAATKPFGIMRFNPGPGVGGHCIPLDPFYLAWKAREYDFPTRFIELAGEINLRMPYFVAHKIRRQLNERSKSMRGSKIVAIGVTYKADVDDYRESPAVKVIELLRSDGADVCYYDPHVSSIAIKGGTLQSINLQAAALAAADCAVILTEHAGIDWELIARNAPFVLDTRNATRGVLDRSRVVML